MENTRAMLFAAGLGTRFKPWTDLHPKALALINGRSLLQRNVVYLQQYGIRKLIVNVHHFADQVLAAIRENHGWGSEITISDERDELLETGGGLKKAAWYFAQDPFVVMNVDILTDLDLGAMMDNHRRHGPLATLAVTGRKTSRYFLFDEQDRLCGWRNVKTGEEKRAGDRAGLREKAFSGIHIIDPQIFNLIGRVGKFSIVDVYLELASSMIIRGFDHTGSKLIDVGKPDSVGEAEKLFL
ncbi:MAG: sugar phosphate nucleotidyltransferase [Puia sp.]|nr:sugar phosphate nucleotidyltransferase [Puia sp.]